MTPTGKVSSSIDTSVLVAFFNRDDEYFSQAKAIIAAQTVPVVLLDVVLHESLALLRKRVSKKVAVEAATQLFHSDFFEFHLSDETIITDALTLFISRKGKYSYADCVITTHTQQLKLPLLSFDPHFRELGLKIIS